MFWRRTFPVALALALLALVGGDGFWHHHHHSDSEDHHCAYCVFAGTTSETASNLTPVLPEASGFLASVFYPPAAPTQGDRSLPTGRSPPSFS